MKQLGPGFIACSPLDRGFVAGTARRTSAELRPGELPAKPDPRSGLLAHVRSSFASGVLVKSFAHR